MNRAPARARRGLRAPGDRRRCARIPARLALALVLAGSALVPPAAGAQARRGPVLIGVLTEAWGPTPAIIGLRAGLEELGYRENEHFVIGIRFTQGDQQALRAAARQLVERGAQILVSGGAGVNEAVAVQMASDGTLPVVFMGGSDPVGAGLVRTLARPGGNVTGVADLDFALAPKRLEIFRELVPGLRRVLLPYNAADPHLKSYLEEYRAAARRLGLVLVERPLRSEAEAEEALGAVRRGEVDGILSPRPLSLNIPGLIVEAGTRQRIPTMLHTSHFVERGGLASYAANLHEMGRHAARLVDKVIKGVRPADIPIEQVTTFELTVNLRTARALGLEVPPVIRLRADRVIE